MSTREDPARRLDWVLLHAQDALSRARLETEAACRRAAAAEARAATLEGSVSFRLGSAIVGATKSWRRLLALPSALLSALRNRNPPATSGIPEFHPQPDTVVQDGIDLTHLFSAVSEPIADLRELRVAAVLDEFSFAAFAPDCHLVNLPSCGFEEILDDLAPHLLLVESAWRGMQDQWRHKICPSSPELRYLVDCCRRRGIPTVFWNKEDPVHFDDFIGAASLFDHILTTDTQCIPLYSKRLGTSVGHLAFCCQPKRHHPIETMARNSAACFAGSWYRFYQERSRNFETIVDAVLKVLPVVIFDRNAGRGDPDFTFPERYAPLIKGTLSYQDIDVAYKGFDYAITVNSVSHSPSMLARRVYELLACNTIVISNPTASLPKIFDGLVVTGDSGQVVEDELRRLHESPALRRRMKLLGLREVLAKHTAAHRLVDIARVASGRELLLREAEVVVAARARNTEEVERIVEGYVRQAWNRKRLVLLLAPGAQGFAAAGLPEEVLMIQDGDDASLAATAHGRWLAMFHPDDYYGSEYLVDLALATLYAPRGAIGKSRSFEWHPEAGLRLTDGMSYSLDAWLWWRASIQPLPACQACDLGAMLSQMEAETSPQLQGLSIDEFSYCRDGARRSVAFVDVVESTLCS